MPPRRSSTPLCSIRRIQAIAALLAILALGAPLAAEPKTGGETHTLFACGDTALARWVHFMIYENGSESALSDLAEMVSGADVAMTNLECVVSSRGRFWDKGERRPYLYRARPEMLDVLTHVGFDVLVTANNHSMDYGPEALLEQLELIEAIGMAQVGCGANAEQAARPTYVRVGDVILAFIGLETNFPKFAATADKPGVHHAMGHDAIIAALREPIAEARKHADLVVFTPHWGGNWTENPTTSRVGLAHEIIDMGVDAILGHSAHHLHGIEIYKGKPILYDMGSFFFDTVGKMRMRLSAGFVLEFNRRGFTKLTAHPLRLHYARTSFAGGKDLERIQEILVKQSKEIDPGIEFGEQGDALTLAFAPDEPPPERQADPPDVHETGQTRKLPDEYRNRVSNVVLDRLPDWAADFDRVKLDNGIEIVGARNSQAVWPRRAFTAEIALEVPGPLKGSRYEARIRGVQRDGEGKFDWGHPIADGAWVPQIWRPGQIVVDRTLVRPARVEEGVYDLYWRFEDLGRRRSAKPVDRSRGDEDGFVKIGEILITSEDIPSGPAGVAWHGNLPQKTEPVVEEGIEVERPGPPPWLWAVIAGAVLALALVVYTVRSRRRRR